MMHHRHLYVETEIARWLDHVRLKGKMKLFVLFSSVKRFSSDVAKLSGCSFSMVVLSRGKTRILTMPLTFY